MLCRMLETENGSKRQIKAELCMARWWQESRDRNYDKAGLNVAGYWLAKVLSHSETKVSRSH